MVRLFACSPNEGVDRPAFLVASLPFPPRATTTTGAGGGKAGLENALDSKFKGEPCYDRTEREYYQNLF